MTRLVQKYHPDLVQSTHRHLAQELDQEGNYRAAEQHYVEAGDWKSAVHMYRGVDMWEDAHRVAQNNGGPNAAKQVLCEYETSYIIIILTFGAQLKELMFPKNCSNLIVYRYS